MEMSVETPIPNEVRPPTVMGKEVYGSGQNVINLSFARFNPETAKEPNPKRMAVYLPGWPWDASAKAVWDFPGQLADGLKTTVLSITALSQKDNPQGTALQAEAMRQFLIGQGMDKSTQLIIVAHSAGGRKGAYLAKNLEDNGFEPAALVLVSPMGLNNRGMVGLLKDFVVDVKRTGKKEREKAGIRAGGKVPVLDKLTQKEIQEGFWDGLSRRWKTGGIGGLASQVRGLVDKDPIYAQIKSPVIDLATDKDKVSNHRSYLPEAEVRENMPPLTPGADVRARQEERVRIAKAREKIAREIFKQSKLVKVIVPTRQADHNGITDVRGQQVPSLIERVIKLTQRATKKAT